MIRLRFWGTRGSTVSPGPATRRYGGNTACVEITGFEKAIPGASRCPDTPRIILDGGTGLLSLQESLMAGPCGQGEGELHILLSHYHWDHIQGIPFFSPLFVPGNRVIFYGISVRDLRRSIERLFTSVYSPHKGAQNVAAYLEYRPLAVTDMNVAGFHLQVASNAHPGDAYTFRLRYGSHTVVYSTDHQSGDRDPSLVALAKGANLWILDAQYTPQERLAHQGWGHSSHLEATRMALMAGVEIAVLFHHNPDHDDRTLDRMHEEAAQMAAQSKTQVVMARDGMAIELR